MHLRKSLVDSARPGLHWKRGAPGLAPDGGQARTPQHCPLSGTAPYVGDGGPGAVSTVPCGRASGKGPYVASLTHRGSRGPSNLLTLPLKPSRPKMPEMCPQECRCAVCSRVRLVRKPRVLTPCCWLFRHSTVTRVTALHRLCWRGWFCCCVSLAPLTHTPDPFSGSLCVTS